MKIEQQNKIGFLARRPNLAAKLSSAKQKGYTMIELAIGVVIAGLILAVTISYVRGIIADNRANDEIREIPLVQSRLTKMYQNRPDFASLTTSVAISNGVYPPERITNATTLNNRFGGAITVEPATTTISNDSVLLTYTNVGAAECKSIVPQLENSMASISVGSSAVKTYGGQVDFAALGTACVANVTIKYTFLKS